MEFDSALKYNQSAEKYEVIVDGRYVTYDEAYRVECEGKFGITLAIVRDVLRFPDARKDLGTTRYFMKQLLGSDDYLLVEVGRVGIENELRIAFVYRVSAELVKQAGSIEPERILSVFVDNFGVPVKIGPQEQKLYLNTIVPIAGSKLDFGFAATQGSNLIGHFDGTATKQDDKESILFHIGFIIDLAKYSASLK